MKSVLHAIPTYCMIVFLLLLSIGREIERMMNSFRWSSNKGGTRGINWLSWENMTMKKDFGGLGFRNLDSFNLSILGKQGRNLISDPEAIVSRVL